MKELQTAKIRIRKEKEIRLILFASKEIKHIEVMNRVLFKELQPKILAYQKLHEIIKAYYSRWQWQRFRSVELDF